jgi:hypothetical protein
MPESYWNAVFTAQEAGSMAEKYAWLLAAEAALGGPSSSFFGSEPALREAARRWPGSLREHQRVAPERYRARERWARHGAESPERARAAWHREGRAAVCLWSELHRLTADVLAWRAAWGRGGGVADFLRDLTRRDPERRAAWPELGVVRAWGSPRVGPGLAEACLAVRAGWDPSTLRACLLDLPAGSA